MVAVEVIKVIILITLLVATFLFSMLPVKMMSAAKKQIDRNKRRKFKVILSLLSCFSAGVFLGTCLLDLFPGVQVKMYTSLQNFGVSTGYPVSEFILVFGLFLILIIEQIVLTFKEGTDNTQYQPLASTDSISSRQCNNNRPPGNTYVPQNRVPSYQVTGDDNSAHVQEDRECDYDYHRQESGSDIEAVSDDNCDEEEELTESQMYQDPSSHSVIRTIILLLALSLHSIFEGLAIGLQRNTRDVLDIFAPVDY